METADAGMGFLGGMDMGVKMNRTPAKIPRTHGITHPVTIYTRGHIWPQGTLARTRLSRFCAVSSNSTAVITVLRSSSPRYPSETVFLLVDLSYSPHLG